MLFDSPDLDEVTKGAWVVTFPTGEYDIGAMGAAGAVNDQLSSFRVRPVGAATKDVQWYVQPWTLK
jgi:hypothetical protein